MIFRTMFPKPYYSVSVGNVIVRRLFTVVEVNSNHACGPEPLFSSRGFRALSARAIYRVGGLRGPAHAIASRSSLVAYSFPDLGNSHSVAAMALSFNSPRELAGAKGGHRSVPGRLSASLSGQAGLSGYFCHRVDSGWRDRLRRQPGAVWKASVEKPALILRIGRRAMKCILRTNGGPEPCNSNTPL